MSEILDFQEGREARMHGKPRDKRRNQHWLLGWDFVNADLAATSDDDDDTLLTALRLFPSPTQHEKE